MTAAPSDGSFLPQPVKRRLGLLQVHVAAVLAGFTGLFGKFLPDSPAVITGGRTVVGCAVVLIAAWFMGVDLRLRRRRDFFGLMVSGVLLAAHWAAFFYSIQISTVAVGLLAFSSYPLFVTVLEPVLFRERWHVADLVTVSVVIAGLVLVVPRFDLNDRMTQGLLWGVLSGLLCAAVALITRLLVREHSAVKVIFYQQGSAALCLLPFGVRSQAEIPGRTVLLLFLLGIAFTAVPQLLQAASLRHLRAQTASIILALEPVYGILFAALFLNEIPSLRTVLGGALVCGAVFSATLRRAPALPV